MRVSNKFQTSQNLIKLPNDFKVVKVDFKSLKDNTVRRLCRDIETQLGLDPVVIKENDRMDMEEYLVKILNDELWDTRDLKTSIVVLTNKGGLLGGRIFTQADFHKRIIDYKQFADNYPIFDDTTTVKQLETGGGRATYQAIGVAGLGLGGSGVHKRLGADPEPDFLPGIHEEILVFALLQRILPDPDRLVVVVPGGVLEAVCRDQDVVEELQGHVDPLLTAALYLAHQNLIQLGSEDQHTEPHPGVRGSVSCTVKHL